MCIAISCIRCSAFSFVWECCYQHLEDTAEAVFICYMCSIDRTIHLVLARGTLWYPEFGNTGSIEGSIFLPNGIYDPENLVEPTTAELTGFFLNNRSPMRSEHEVVFIGFQTLVEFLCNSLNLVNRHIWIKRSINVY